MGDVCRNIEEDAPLNVIIIGSGFTGTMIAVHLARLSRRPLQITLVERAPRFAQGIAYSTTDPHHLLNVPAGRMSAFAGDDDHFLRWAVRHQGEAHGESYLPRSAYSTYLSEVLQESISTIALPSSLNCLRAQAISVTKAPSGGWTVHFSDADAMTADAVVLAIGNYPPSDPPCETPEFYASDFYQSDAWADRPADANGDVLLLGTGLTMIDVVVTLHQRGHRGRISCISRRGLVPQSHVETSTASPHLPPPPDWEQWPRTAPDLCREIRAAVARAVEAGWDWRDVMNSLRSITPRLWASLPENERQRFLSHLRPFWETHRHRAAPAIGRLIQQLRESGQLSVIAGRVRRFHVSNAAVDVAIARRGRTATEIVRVARVINCTGPDTDLSRIREPLVQNLLRQGMIRANALRLGLDSDADGRLIDHDGHAHNRLFLAGPLRRGQLWENTAVPELRIEAERLSRHILGDDSLQVAFNAPTGLRTVRP